MSYLIKPRYLSHRGEEILRLQAIEAALRRIMMKVGGEAKPPRDVKCPHCGQVVPYDNNTCANCGKPLS